MRIVKLKGGLGNQMFQYAFAKLLEQQTGEEIKLDLNEYKELYDDQVRIPRIQKFNLSLTEITDIELKRICLLNHKGNPLTFKYRLGIAIEKAFNRKYYFEKDRSYRKLDFIKNYTYFDGYWQAWKYVEPIIDILKKEFIPNYIINNKTNKTIEQVLGEQSVFVGIRKGDYELEQKHYGKFEQEYYERAFKIVEEKLNNPVYYIFSNNIEWVKNNINFGKRRIVYRENNDIVDDFEEFLIMSSCKHDIITNSPFHWWAAILHGNRKKVIIAPQKWFFDNKPISIYPENWIKI